MDRQQQFAADAHSLDAAYLAGDVAGCVAGLADRAQPERGEGDGSDNSGPTNPAVDGDAGGGGSVVDRPDEPTGRLGSTTGEEDAERHGGETDNGAGGQ